MAKEIKIRKEEAGYVVHIGTGQGAFDYTTYGPFETEEEAETKAEELRESDEGYEY